MLTTLLTSVVTFLGGVLGAVGGILS